MRVSSEFSVRICYFNIILPVVAVLFIRSGAFSQSEWIWQNPFPQGSDIQGVSFVDADHGYTVGIFGTINRTTDGGQTWIHCRSGVAFDLNAVSFTDVDHGTAVGKSGTILRTTDAGLTWLKQSSGTTTWLRAVSFVTPNSGTAVGVGGIILRTSNGGTNWLPQSSGTTSHLSGLSFSDLNHGIAVGFEGLVIRTTDGGSTWMPGGSGTANQLSGVDCIDANTGTAVGSNGTILHTTDGGATWSPQTSGTTEHLSGVSMTGNLNGAAVGTHGTIRRTTDGGSTWILSPSGTTEALFNTVLTDANSGWAVGRFGTLLHTNDGGASWTSQTKGTQLNLHGVAFTDTNNGVAVGDSGLILRTVDGGLSWLPEYSGTTLNLAKVALPQDGQGVIVGDGGTILHSTDGGGWVPRYSVLTSPLFAVSFPTPNFGVATGQAGLINQTTDGGATWELISDPLSNTMYTIFMYDSYTGLTAGVGGWARRTVSGWNPLPIIWDLALPPGRPIFDVHLTNGHTGTAVGGGGTILHSTQAMAFSPWWTVINSGTTATLQAITFTDSANAIVVGESGTIIRSADGGLTWSPEQSGTIDHLNDVAFVGADRGWIVGDGGAILHYRPLVDETSNQFTVQDSWNIVSVPFGVVDYAASTLFPDAITSAFGFDNAYVPQDTLENGKGYWLKYPQAQTIVMNGSVLEAETVDVAADWNMVGSLSTPVDVTTITSIPGGIITSGFYQFDQSYTQTSILLPGRGFWVKSSQAGQLVMTSSANTPASTRIRIEDRGEMPPAPPHPGASTPEQKPREFRLDQNSPNPFNPSTSISYTLPVHSLVNLRIYDLLGRVISTLVNTIEEPGEHIVRWDAGGVPSGIYFYRLVAGDITLTRKMIVMR